MTRTYLDKQAYIPEQVSAECGRTVSENVDAACNVVSRTSRTRGKMELLQASWEEETQLEIQPLIRRPDVLAI